MISMASGNDSRTLTISLDPGTASVLAKLSPDELVVCAAAAQRAVEETAAGLCGPLEHLPWCDVDDACVGTTAGSHYGRRHVMTWDDDDVEGRNNPGLEELGIRAALHQGRPIVDIEVDTETSGCEEVMWLTPSEARRYAQAILRAADELDGART